MRGLGENYLLFTWKLLKITGLQFSCALSCWYFRDCFASLWGQTHPTPAESLLAYHAPAGNCCHFPKKVNYFLAALTTLSASELTLNYPRPPTPPRPVQRVGGSPASSPGFASPFTGETQAACCWDYGLSRSQLPPECSMWSRLGTVPQSLKQTPFGNSPFSYVVSIAFSHRRIRTLAPVPIQVQAHPSAAVWVCLLSANSHLLCSPSWPFTSLLLLPLCSSVAFLTAMPFRIFFSLDVLVHFPLFSSSNSTQNIQLTVIVHMNEWM